MTRRNMLLGGLSGATTLVTGSALAQNKAAGFTLQDALLKAKVMPQVSLVIGPQWELQPKGKLVPRDGSTPGAIADAFGRSFLRFGGVWAIGQEKMDIINPNPTNPNPFDGMPTWDLMPLFAASLKEEQWRALVSEQGLGIGSLTAKQQQIIQGIFPEGKMSIAPWVAGQDVNEKQIKDLSSELMRSSLRIKQSVSIDIPSATGGYYLRDHVVPEGADNFRLVEKLRYFGSQKSIFGQKVREELPNRPKKGQLNLDSSIFLKPISLKGVTTVKEMMERIAKETKVELYADYRWGFKTLMMIGSPTVATAGDLLKAMAFCLTGTFRKVGPAFVMTDDVVGYDTKCQRWVEFEKLANTMRVQYVEEARDTLYKRYKGQEFSTFGDPTALTPEQRKKSSYDTRGALSSFTPE
jgi:hypothetical protein